jgi:hypothetical protein
MSVFSSEYINVGFSESVLFSFKISKVVGIMVFRGGKPSFEEVSGMFG